jgi:hypothetical protein
MFRRLMMKVEVKIATIWSVVVSGRGQASRRRGGGLTWKTKTKVTYHLVMKVGMVRFAIILLRGQSEEGEMGKGGLLGGERDVSVEGGPPLGLVRVLGVPLGPDLLSPSHHRHREREREQNLLEFIRLDSEGGPHGEVHVVPPSLESGVGSSDSGEQSVHEGSGVELTASP